MKTHKLTLAGAGMALALAVSLFGTAVSHDEPGLRPHHIDVPANPTAVMRAFTNGKFGDEQLVQNLAAVPQNACVGGFADVYPCDEVDLMSFMPLADMGQTQSNDEANDIWGWTDPVTGDEYAIIGRVFGTSFVRVTDPANPVFVGELDTHGRFGSPWRDIKVYNDHAFIVSEARRHGMQVFDLTQLRGLNGPPVLFQETAHYNGFGSAHNIVINEDSGYAYGVGTDKCAGGLEMVNIQNPTNPTDAGCFDADGYTHDAQCVIYGGPDADHTGKEICFASNEDTLTIVDVTNKSNPVQLSRTPYIGAYYTHQGWLTEDQRWFLLDDELDEQNTGNNTLTHIWDLLDLDSPVLQSSFFGTTSAIDHNQYIRGNCSFQANYRAGLRILEFNAANPADGGIFESAYFDIYPADDANQFNAAWSNYPYFASGNVIVSGIEQGLYVLRPTDAVLNACGIDTSVNTPPTSTIDAPADGAIVSGSAVAVAATASDAEDAAGTLTVEWQVDGGAWNIMTWDGIQYTGTWDTTSLSDGAHTLSIRATDSGGASAGDSHTVTTDNGNVPADMHVHALSATTATGRGGKWDANVTITILEENESTAVSNATVNGSWSNGTNGSGACVTDAGGQCTISQSNISRNSASATFTVDTVSHATLAYDAADNDVNSIVVNNPN